MRIPKYKTVQKILNRAFYDTKSGVFIFTEDKPSDIAFYSLLFGRLKHNEFEILKVQPIGSKSDVIERSVEDIDPQTPSIYIVDGDIKLMLGQKLENKNLIALDRYCIENFLCCETGIIEYLYVKLGTKKEEIKKELDFENYLKKNGKLILNLYYRYALAYQLQCGASFKNLDALAHNGGGTKNINSVLLNAEINSVETIIKEKLKQNGVRAFNKEMKDKINKIKNDNPICIESVIKVISGKDFLLPLLCSRIKELDRSSGALSSDQLKRLLAEKVSLEPLKRIQSKILTII